MTSPKSQTYMRHRAAFAALVIVLIVTAIAFSSRGVLSQVSDPQRRDLERVFTRHERLSLDPGQIARQVKQTHSLTLNTSRGTFEMTLEPHDMRAPGYVAEAWGDKGSVRVLERAPVRTYKGTVQGMPEAQARMTIDEETVEGLIITPGELFYLEPSTRFSGSAAKTDFVFYAASDVKESAGECGNTMAEMVAQHSASVSDQSSAKSPQPEAVFGPAMEIAVATEADYEYWNQSEFQGTGNPEAAVTNKILTIMSQVDGIYNSQMGLKFLVTNTRVWTTASDPYTSPIPPETSIDASTALGQFRTYYSTNAPPAAATRDIAHLFMGRDFAGSTIGIAYRPGLDCPLDPSAFAYGISQYLGPTSNLAGLTAHEIGHNLNANHVNSAQGSDCTSSVMNPSISPAQNFCQFSRDEITTHAIANDACLTATGPECASVPGSSSNIPANGGSVSVNVTASPTCNWAVAEGASWLTVTSGASGTGNGTVVFSATGNSCGPRTALVNVGGQILSVAQNGNPIYLTDPATATAISPGQTLNGDLTSGDCATGLPDSNGIRSNAFMDRYKFNGMAGQRIRIDMRSAIAAPAGVDTYLYLYGPDGNLVDENDDLVSGSQTDSRIPCPADSCGFTFRTLTQTGTYIIIATSYSNGDTGAYSITLSSEPLLLNAQVTDSVGSAAALNSVTFARASNANSNPPYTAFRIFDPFNFSADQTTRIILFTSDLGLTQQQNPSQSVLSVSAGGQSLVVEHVGPFTFPFSPGFPAVNGSYIVVALKRVDAQSLVGVPGSFAFAVTRPDPITSSTLTSNTASITIVP